MIYAMNLQCQIAGSFLSIFQMDCTVFNDDQQNPDYTLNYCLLKVSVVLNDEIKFL